MGGLLPIKRGLTGGEAKAVGASALRKSFEPLVAILSFGPGRQNSPRQAWGV